jgi:transcription elongation factor Elf1
MPYKDQELKRAKDREYAKNWYSKPENAAKSRARASIRRKKNRKLIRQFVREYKESHPCKQCGESHVACLDFHHLDEDKKTENIADMVHRDWSLKTIKAEIEKCEILCRNCHAKKHFAG